MKHGFVVPHPCWQCAYTMIQTKIQQHRSLLFSYISLSLPEAVAKLLQSKIGAVLPPLNKSKRRDSSSLRPEPLFGQTAEQVGEPSKPEIALSKL